MTWAQFFISILRSSVKASALALALALPCAVILFATEPAQAQTLSVIYSFTYYGQESPVAGLTIDNNGTLYGTTTYTDSGQSDGGVFKLRQSGSNWIYTPLYGFSLTGNRNPQGPLLLAPDGTLYGTLYTNGGCPRCGGVFHLFPSPNIQQTALAPWAYTSLYSFTGGSDGSNPSGVLTFDQSRNIYGTTASGGSAGLGTIYELTRSGDTWTETVLHSAQGHRDGVLPVNGVAFDSLGNLYGVYQGEGPYGQGAVYELSFSGSGWTEQILYGFTGGSDG